MKNQIVRVSVLQNAKVMAVLYLVISLPLVLCAAIPIWVAGQKTFPLFLLVLLPILYTGFGFLLTAIAAWIYNLVAARVGGFEFTLAESTE
jgi:hypothetical protein